MDLTKFLLVHTFVAGLIGIPVGLYAASLKLSTESIESPKAITRWFYRYFIFSHCFLLSFMFSPMIFWPVIKHLQIEQYLRDAPLVIFIFPIPAALAIYFLMRKIKISSDAKKLRARAQLGR